MGLERKAALIALALAWSSPALTQEPVEFKGVALGATMQAFREKNPLFICIKDACILEGFDIARHCVLLLKRTPPGAPTSRDQCLADARAAATYANQQALLIAQFKEGTLISGSATFQPSGFDVAVRALTARFGEGMKTTDQEVGPGGVPLEQETVMWKREDAVILARKYGSRAFDRSRVVVYTPDAWQSTLREVERRRKAPEKDL